MNQLYLSPILLWNLMEHLKIVTKITVCSYEELHSEEKKMIEAAKEAAKKAYAPYSNFQVGAAVFLENTTIVTGNNQENVAYPSGLCAERTAVFYANAQYPEQSVQMLAVTAFSNGDFTEMPITPCGACRQVLLETENWFGKPIQLLLYGTKKIYKIGSVKELLPLCFGEELPSFL